MIYDPETGEFLRDGKRLGYLDKDGYRIICVKRKKYRAGRLAWFISFGCWPSGEIDHENRIRDDDRLVNLVDATVSRNRMNTNVRGTSKSEVKGVRWNRHSKSWHARIQYQGKTRSLGYFKELDDAREFRELAESITRPWSNT